MDRWWVGRVCVALLIDFILVFMFLPKLFFTLFFFIFLYICHSHMQNILANKDIIDHDSIILQCKIKLLICFLFRVRSKHKPPSFIF
jgi:hypothetical protein